MDKKNIYTTDNRVKHFSTEKEINVMLGEIGKDSIYDVWNGKKWKELRPLQKNHKYCDFAACKDCAERIYPQI